MIGRVSIVILAALLGCSEADPPQPTTSAAETNTYEVRGVVVDLPRAGDPTSEFVVSHEALPDFVRSDGSLGMNAMVMPFVPQNEVAFDGISVGDKIAFTWVVWWEGRIPRSTIADLRRLDQDTPLELVGQNPGG